MFQVLGASLQACGEDSGIEVLPQVAQIVTAIQLADQLLYFPPDPVHIQRPCRHQDWEASVPINMSPKEDLDLRRMVIFPTGLLRKAKFECHVP